MEPYVLMLQTDVDDMYITQSTLSEIGNTIPVKFIASFREIETLIAASGPPAVILLNDRGAIRSGNEVLRQLKSHVSYAHIPVVVLGEVSSEDYIRECYRAGANSYITKPSSVVDTRKKIELFFKYWFEVAEL